MRTFKVIALLKDDPERKYEPVWDDMVEAELIGEAYEKGNELFVENNPGLDHSKFEVRVI